MSVNVRKDFMAKKEKRWSHFATSAAEVESSVSFLVLQLLSINKLNRLD